MASTSTPVYEELVEFLEAGTTPQAIVDYKPSEKVKDRVGDLIRRQKFNSLTPEEAAELNHYLEVEHLMRLAKARARQYLSTP